MHPTTTMMRAENIRAAYPGGSGTAYDRRAVLPQVPEKSEAAAGSMGGMGYSAGAMKHGTTGLATAGPNGGGDAYAVGKRKQREDDPFITPTVHGKPLKITKAFMSGLKKLQPPPLAGGGPQPQPQAGVVDLTGDSAEAPSKSRPNPASGVSPLDLLSTVSTHIAKKENVDKNQTHQNTARNNNNVLGQSRQDSPDPYVGERHPTTGLRHGRGVMAYPNGCKYSGEFLNDKRHGFGECTYPNGCHYSGFWSEGKRDGVGRMIYADRGDVFEGEWSMDRRHGRGVYFRSDGRADVSTYHRHDMVGEGVQWSPNREFVVRLIDGINHGPISVGMALQICQRIGVPGAPKRMFPESEK